MKTTNADVRKFVIVAAVPVLYALMGMQLGCFFPEPDRQPRSGRQDRRDEHREGDRDHRENHEGREQDRGRPEDSNHR